MLNALSRNRRNLPTQEPVVARDPFFQFVDRFFNEYATPTIATWQPGERSWFPLVDVVEHDNAFIATADLPGLKKEDIEISLEDGVLTISGERKFEHESKEDGKNFKRLERAYGRFSRSFTLPQGIDAQKVEAVFADGVLRLTLPKNEVIKARKISIS